MELLRRRLLPLAQQFAVRQASVHLASACVQSGCSTNAAPWSGWNRRQVRNTRTSASIKHARLIHAARFAAMRRLCQRRRGCGVRIPPACKISGGATGRRCWAARRTRTRAPTTPTRWWMCRRMTRSSCAASPATAGQQLRMFVAAETLACLRCGSTQRSALTVRAPQSLGMRGLHVNSGPTLQVCW